MQRSVVSSCSGVAGDWLQEFLTDMRTLVLKAAALSPCVQQDARCEEACNESYKRDSLLYQQACEMGMGMAGMVACSIDGMT